MLDIPHEVHAGEGEALVVLVILGNVISAALTAAAIVAALLAVAVRLAARIGHARVVDVAAVNGIGTGVRVGTSVVFAGVATGVEGVVEPPLIATADHHGQHGRKTHPHHPILPHDAPPGKST